VCGLRIIEPLGQNGVPVRAQNGPLGAKTNLSMRAQAGSPTAQAIAATAQGQRRKWKMLISRFRRRIPCFKIKCLAAWGRNLDQGHLRSHAMIADHIHNPREDCFMDLGQCRIAHLPLLHSCFIDVSKFRSIQI
jgi:hypothetical protein